VRGCVVFARKRFEMRITAEDRQRLRALADRQGTTASEVVRLLLREAKIAANDDNAERKEEAVAA
jgi:predicted DNA-binding protein